MALVVGTNCGFCLVAPTADPAGVPSWSYDNYAIAAKHVAPAGATKVIEVGWWADNPTEAANYQVGIYSHDSVNNRPKDLLASTADIAKGTTAGWKTGTISCAITAGETYWIAMVCDNTATYQSGNDATDATQKANYLTQDTPFVNPWTPDGTDTRIISVYAVYTTGGGEGGTDIYLRPGHATLEDIILRDPTQSGAGGAHSLVCAAGTFSLSGQDVTLKSGRVCPIGTGTFTLTGQDVTLTYNPGSGSHSLACEAGAFTLSGQAISFLRGLIMPAAVGAFTLTGQAVALKHGYTLACSAGSFSLSGQAVTLKAGRGVPAGAGTFTLSGQAVALKRGYTLAAGAGSFALSGQTVTLIAGHLCAAGAGAFTLTGQDVTLTYTPGAGSHSLPCATGAFVLTGEDVALRRTRIPTVVRKQQPTTMGIGDDGRGAKFKMPEQPVFPLSRHKPFKPGSLGKNPFGRNRR